MENIILNKENQIATITLNRPQILNALDQKIFDELKTAVEDVRADGSVRVLIIKGAGRAFSSGIDLTSLAKPDVKGGSTFKDARERIRGLQETFNSIENMEKPSIASMHGFALGAALELALACDIRIASEETKMGLLEVKYGLVPDLGGSFRLPRLVGAGRAKELILTGGTIDAKEAERIGLVNRAVPAEKLEEETRALANRLLKVAPVAVGLSKTVLNKALGSDLKTAQEAEIYAQSLCMQTRDFIEAVTAYMQKREPNFKGK